MLLIESKFDAQVGRSVSEYYVREDSTRCLYC